jgi:glycosyltransferase involved in cell wall biosynthesis
LKALLTQARDVGGEVVVIDDGSGDHTPGLLTRLARSDTALRWIRQTASGPAAARNRGMEVASGRIVFFTGDDMYPAPGLLEGHVRAHAVASRSAVLGHVAWDPAMRTSPLMRMMAPNGPLFNFAKLRRSRCRLHRFFYTANLSMRAEDLGSERFHEGFEGAAFEDAELGVRLERAGIRLVYRPDLLVSHRHALSARAMTRRLSALRTGRKLLSALHPELAPGLRGRAADLALEVFVRTWVPLEWLLHLGPSVPEDWTNDDI